MSGFCSAHKHFEPGCSQCEATGNNDPFGPVILDNTEIDQIPKSVKNMILAKHGEIDSLRAEIASLECANAKLNYQVAKAIAYAKKHGLPTDFPL